MLAATNWRDLRSKLRNDGISNVMDLPSMHDVLDAMEYSALESMSNGKPEENKRQREHFRRTLYRPVIRAIPKRDRTVNIEDIPVPAWFGDDDDSTFDKATKTAR